MAAPTTPSKYNMVTFSIGFTTSQEKNPGKDHAGLLWIGRNKTRFADPTKTWTPGCFLVSRT